MGMNKFGIGDRVTLVREATEHPRHITVYEEYPVTGIYSGADGNESRRYMLRGFPDDVGEAELYATDADLMDRVRRFAEAGRNGERGLIYGDV
jgi:hypothetical protein